MLRNDLAIVVNTNFTYSDIWPMFFGQFEKYNLNRFKTYVFVDEGDYPELSKYNLLYYNKNQCFRDQYLSCIKRVSEEIVLTLNDDYVMLDFDELKEYISILESDNNYSFIRFVYIDDNTQIKLTENLYKIPFYSNNLFSQCASVWKTRDLEKVYQIGPKLHIGCRGEIDGHFEQYANQICMSIGIEGLVVHDNNNKRGIVHYDSVAFPCMSSAIVKGKWNMEYKKELEPLFEKYKINSETRGFYQC